MFNTEEVETNRISGTNPGKEAQVFQDGALVVVSIGKSSWKTTLTPSDFGMDKFPKNFEPGRRKLLPDEALRKIDYIEGQARRTVDKFSFDFGLPNTRAKYRWVNIAKLGLVLVTLDEHKDSFFRAVDSLITGYEAYKLKMQQDFPDQWPMLQQHYPAVASIRKNYYFEYETLNMVFPSGMSAVTKYELQQADLALLDRERAEAMTQEEMRRMQTSYQERLDRVLEEQRQMATTRAEAFVDSAARQIRGKVVDVFKAITDKIRDGKTLIKTNLDTLRGTLDEVRQLDFIGGDAEFEAQLERVRTLMDSGREFRDERESIDELNRLLSDTVAHVQRTESEVSAASRQTYFKRRMNLNASVSDGPAGGNENKSIAEGQFDARND